MKSGILNVYKEAGYTSFDVIARLRGILKIKKIGHTGTLDPDATGVLPVCIGKATKVGTYLSDHDKTYEAVMLLGISTDTQDISGEVVSKREVGVSEQDVRNVISSFVGQQLQIPPMYSAKKVGGKKLYEYARAGVTVERKPSSIVIYDITILSVHLPEVSLRIHCSKGTYVRTLLHDIGEKLGCGACMKELVRTSVGSFAIAKSLSLDEIEEFYRNGTIEEYLLSIDRVFLEYPAVFLEKKYDTFAINGNAIALDDSMEAIHEGGRVRLYLSDHRFVGIFYEKDGFLKPEKMFLE